MKNRNLSIPEFLENLQKEYFLAVLRSKIYPSIKKKNYYKKLIGYKEEKILNISKKYHLPCIFDEKGIFNKYKIMIFGETFPNFFYKGDQEKNDLELSDEINYYLKDSNVRVVHEDSSELGVILRYNLLDKSVKVKLNDGGWDWFDRNKINRIL